MKLRISKETLMLDHHFPDVVFPKYTTQIMNLANQNAQGTRPSVVGQMSELFPLYKDTSDNPSFEGWKEWYLTEHPGAIDRATDKIMAQIGNLKEAIQLIDRAMVKRWVTDLVINKTCKGLYYQPAILAYLAERNQTEWRLANPEEEAKGIDGYVGSQAYSIKPESYKMMDRLPETFHIAMIYYSVSANGDLSIEMED